LKTFLSDYDRSTQIDRRQRANAPELTDSELYEAYSVKLSKLDECSQNATIFHSREKEFTEKDSKQAVRLA